MRAWKSAEVPQLPGKAPQPKLYDSAAQKIVELEAEDTASLYVCGITPYDATHMGHASTYVAFDMLNRAWKDAGSDVVYVQNVTDVDDPLLERAEATGVDWRDLAEEQTDLFRADMEALNVIAPDHYMGAVETIPLVVEAVETLLERGIAYRVEGFEKDGVQQPAGDVYFDVNRAAEINAEDPEHWVLGQICNLNRDAMYPIFAERGGDPQRPGKRDPFDPLLWRVERDGEPSWDGRSLGKGRPGWHIECTTIAQKYLPAPFSVQAGGSDLQFPHHDMGAGHAYALTGKPMARHYAHAGMVGLDGEKMSKSLGNLVLVSKLRAQGVDPSAIRLAILANHYRDDWFWTDDILEKAKTRLEVYRQAIGLASAETDEAAEATLKTVRKFLADDLNTLDALSALDDWALSTLKNGRGGGAKLITDLLNARLGVIL